MATNFPASLDSLTNPSSGNTLNSPSHSTQHANANDAIEVLEAKVGVDNSAVTTSLDYKVRIGNPVGEIAMWSTNTAPTGWLLCDGIDKDRSTYSALHSLMAAAGYPFGAGNGSTTFGIPNLLGKFPVGKDASAEFNVLGETGGGKTRVLGVSNLPAHTHTASSSSSSSSSSTVTDNGHSHPEAGRENGATTAYKYLQRIGGAGSNYDVVGTSLTRWDSITNPATASTTTGITVATSTSTSTSTTVNTSGGNGTATGNAFNILPPYIALNFIIRF
jgi:microcystin-dependent protein